MEYMRIYYRESQTAFVALVIATACCLLLPFNIPYALAGLVSIESALLLSQAIQLILESFCIDSKHNWSNKSHLFCLICGIICGICGTRFPIPFQLVRLMLLILKEYSMNHSINKLLDNAIKPKSIPSPTFKNGLLEYIDQAYFLCAQIPYLNDTNTLSAPYINKRGQDILKENNLAFFALCDQLIEVEGERHSLKDAINQILNKNEETTGPTKLWMKLYKRKPERTKQSAIENNIFDKTNACPFTSYKAKVFKKSKTEVIIILNERNMSTSVLMADKLKKTIVCTLSHDLKTLLNGVIGSLDLLESPNLGEEGKISLKEASSASRILAYKLNDLFDLIQLQNKEFKLHCEEFGLDGVCRRSKVNKIIGLPVRKESRELYPKWKIAHMERQ